MNNMGALTSITAKVMIIVDQLLENFVHVSSYATTQGGLFNCGINVIGGELTGCGISLVSNLADLVYYLVYLGAGFLPALGAVS